MKVHSTLHERKSKVSKTAGTWSSGIFKGYLVVTGHYLCRDWRMRYTAIDVQRFRTQLTWNTVREFAYGLIENWNLLGRVQSVTTDNASYMINGIEMLWKGLLAQSTASTGCEDLKCSHVRCLPHIIDLLQTAYMDTIGYEIDKIFSLKEGCIHLCKDRRYSQGRASKMDC